MVPLVKTAKFIRFLSESLVVLALHVGPFSVPFFFPPIALLSHRVDLIVFLVDLAVVARVLLIQPVEVFLLGAGCLTLLLLS